MLDTIVTFQDGAEKVLTLFSIRSACRSRRAKHAGYYCDVSRWRRKGTHTFLDTFRLADKIRRRLLRRRNNNKYVSEVTFYITEDEDRKVDLNDIDISMTVLMKEQ